MLIARVIADTSVLETQLDAATTALEREGMTIASAQMLDFCGDVLQIMLASDDLATCKRVLEQHFQPADMIIARDEFAMPNVFISDMDSTMIGQECIDELADFAGLKDKIAAITERAMLGELDFESALRERVGLLAGLDEGAIERCLAEGISPNPGARLLVETLKSKGCKTVLVTGGFHHFADVVAEQIGFERVVGNRLKVDGGKLTGGLIGAIVDSSVKHDVLREELGHLGDGAVSMAAGDGANDIPMLQAATYGIAYYAKPKAREAANGIIERGDLTSLLQLLDIPQTEWVG